MTKHNLSNYLFCLFWHCKRWRSPSDSSAVCPCDLALCNLCISVNVGSLALLQTLALLEPTRRHLRCFVVLPSSQYFPFIWSGSASQHIYWQMTENTTYSVLVQSHLTCVFSFSHFKSYLSSNPVVLIGKQGGRGLLVLYQKANVWRAVCLHLCSLSHRVSQFIIKCVCVRAQNLFVFIAIPACLCEHKGGPVLASQWCCACWRGQGLLCAQPQMHGHCDGFVWRTTYSSSKTLSGERPCLGTWDYLFSSVFLVKPVCNVLL